MTLTACTISGNTASNNGGGLADYGTAILINSTLSGNTASHSGGALFSNRGNTLTLTDCTVSGNSSKAGGGLYNFGAVKMINTIVAGNTNDSQKSSDIGGPGKVSGSYNLIGTGARGAQEQPEGQHRAQEPQEAAFGTARLKRRAGRNHGRAAW